MPAPAEHHTSNGSPLVSIIIVNTNEEAFVASCVRSIIQFEPRLHKEIIIVDNASRADVSQWLPQQVPDVRIIRLAENQGFCRANNVGIRQARGAYVLLLNPDTLLLDDAISQCLAFMQQRQQTEKVGAVGCRLIDAKGNMQKSFYWSAVSLWAAVQANPLYMRLFGHAAQRRGEARDAALHSSVNAVPWLCGAFLLMQRSVLEKESFYLDEDFFLYSDDVELGARMRKKGYRLLYYPGAAVVHYGGGGTNVPTRKFEQLTISKWLCMFKVHGAMYFLLHQMLLLINQCMNELLFWRRHLKGRSTFTDRRHKVIRRVERKLLYRYTFIILFRYWKNQSRSMLIYCPDP